MKLEDYISEAVSHGRHRIHSLDIDSITSLEDLERFLMSNGYHQIDMVDSKDMLSMFGANEKVYCLYKKNNGYPMSVQVYVGPISRVYRLYLDNSEKHLDGECYWNMLEYGRIVTGPITLETTLRTIRDYARSLNIYISEAVSHGRKVPYNDGLTLDGVCNWLRKLGFNEVIRRDPVYNKEFKLFVEESGKYILCAAKFKANGNNYQLDTKFATDSSEGRIISMLLYVMVRSNNYLTNAAYNNVSVYREVMDEVEKLIEKRK